jgi:hypothetical protein
VKTTQEVRDAALADLAERDDDEPCRALHGMAVIDSLDFDDEDAVVAWRKLADKRSGKPCGKVRQFAEYAKTKKPELRQHLLTEFCKRVKNVPR